MGEDFSTCQESTKNFGANFGANFGENFGNFVSNFVTFFGNFVQQRAALTHCSLFFARTLQVLVSSVKQEKSGVK